MGVLSEELREVTAGLAQTENIELVGLGMQFERVTCRSIQCFIL